MKKSLTFLAAALLLATFFACEDKEEDGNKPYVGKWKSNFYPTIKISTGDTILEQMSFEFTNNSFTDAIAQSTGKTDINVVVQVTIGGSVKSFDTDSMEVAINTIKLINGAESDKSQDPTTFNSLFDLAVGSLLYQDFNAHYNFYSDNDSMRLTLPVKYMGMKVSKTIKLGKQK